jgi:nitrite reductase/ring-hydroxylating ferredoxin subunit
MSEHWRAVARVGDLKSGDLIAVEIDGVAIALGRDGDRYFAVQRQCLHSGGDLAAGIVSRGHVVCPQHGWRFSTATGCNDAHAAFALARYPVRVTSGNIEIDPRPLPREEEGSQP